LKWTAETILKMVMEEVQQVISCLESLAETAEQLPKLMTELTSEWQLGNTLRDQRRAQWGERGGTGGIIKSIKRKNPDGLSRLLVSGSHLCFSTQKPLLSLLRTLAHFHFHAYL
jgi:hypothetical protein